MALTNWDNYFVAMAGAAAALTGLIFVSLSISLNKIHTIPQLVDRALESLVILFTILVISSLCLVPGQSYLWLGLEILIASALTWGFVSSLDVRIYRRIDKEYKNVFLAHALLSQLAILPYIVGACVSMLYGNAGIYWLIPAIIFSFMKSLLDAWVLLIEINR